MPKNEFASILDIAKRHNPASRGLALDRPEYDELREILREFVFARGKNLHRCGMTWFADTGIPELNKQRRKAGRKALPNDISHTTLLKYARIKWPEQAKAFKK